MGYPPFNGKTHSEIVEKIKMAKLGVDLKIEAFNKIPESAKDLLQKLLVYDYEKRISAQNALNHAYFKENLDSKEINFTNRAKNLESFQV